MRRLMIVSLCALATAAVPAAAPAANYGHFLGHARASGSSSATSIGWGPRLTRSARHPHSFTVVVRGTLNPGYFCQSSCREVNVQWDTACSRPGLLRSRQGGMFGALPKVGHPKLALTSPRSCTVHVEAHPNSYVGGTLNLWLYYR